MLLGIEGVGLIVMGFWLWAIFDVISTDEMLVRNLPKGAWVMLVIFLFDIGALAWLILGRPQHVGFRPGDTSPRRVERWERPPPLEAADRNQRAIERRKSLAEQRAEYEELDRRLIEERAQRRRELEETIGKHDQRAKDLADWEADLLRRERELRENKPDDA